MIQIVRTPETFMDKKRRNPERATTWVDKLSAFQREKIDKSIVEYIYRCNISFNSIESNAFKNFIKTIRPA